MPSYWNYPSSREQNRQELLQMYKSLTDKTEKKKLNIQKRREARKQTIAQDSGI